MTEARGASEKKSGAIKKFLKIIENGYNVQILYQEFPAGMPAFAIHKVIAHL